MARKPRIEVPNGIYHIVSRGNNKQDIFDEQLRALHLRNLASVARTFDWFVVAWALMTNHYHVVLQITDKGLAAGMQQLNLRLARASNARFGRINHALGQRYWSKLIERDEHLRASIRYTLWNPARAGVCATPADSSWTSFRASVGLERAPDTLALGRLHGLFDHKPADGYDRFARFVMAGQERCLQPWNDGKGIFR
jgi:REP element-mobilizing transposase RayT